MRIVSSVNSGDSLMSASRSGLFLFSRIRMKFDAAAVPCVSRMTANTRSGAFSVFASSGDHVGHAFGGEPRKAIGR